MKTGFGLESRGFDITNPIRGQKNFRKEAGFDRIQSDLTKTAHLHKWSVSLLSKIDRIGDPESVHTKDWGEMKFVSFEDKTGIHETVYFPKTCSRFCHILKAFRPFILKGTVQETFSAVNLTVEEAAFGPTCSPG